MSTAWGGGELYRTTIEERSGTVGRVVVTRASDGKTIVFDYNELAEQNTQLDIIAGADKLRTFRLRFRARGEAIKQARACPLSCWG